MDLKCFKTAAVISVAAGITLTAASALLVRVGVFPANAGFTSTHWAIRDSQADKTKCPSDIRGNKDFCESMIPKGREVHKTAN